MTDPARFDAGAPTPPPPLPPMANAVVSAVARHLLSVIAGALAAHGALSSSQTDQFEQIGLGLVVWGASLAWSYWQKRHARTVLVAAINAPAPGQLSVYSTAAIGPQS